MLKLYISYNSTITPSNEELNQKLEDRHKM